jgi:hypothetical protein
MRAARVGGWAPTKGLVCAAHLTPQLRPLLAPDKLALLVHGVLLPNLVAATGLDARSTPT